MTLFMSVIMSYAYACDVCGCSASGFSSGFMNLNSSHFLGLSYKTKSYESTHPTLFANQPVLVSSEQFQTLELNARWMPNKHVQIIANAPFHFFNRSENEVSETAHGLGDASAIAQWVITNSSDSADDFLYRFAFGGGVKAPTGKSNFLSDSYQIIIPNMQPGTGAWDVLLNANGILKMKNWGLLSEFNFSRNGTNKNDYKFGDRTGAKLSVSRWLNTKEKRIILRPEVGAQIMSSRYDFSSYSEGITNEFSHGYFVDALLGAQLLYQTWSFSASAQLPIAQDFANGYVKSKWGAVLQIHYLIPTNQKK